MSDISHKHQTFLTDFGVNATVRRETVSGEAASKPNRHLADLGLACHPLPHTETKYLGSAAVHVYYNELLEQIWFVSQTQPLELYHCPKGLASKALDDLRRQMQTMYGDRAGRLRSGF